MADIEIKPITWRTCAEDGCIGACLPNGDTCWAHAIDADVDQALKRLGIDGRLDARGVPITPELLERMLAAAPDDGHGRPRLTNPEFNKATFQGDARFHEAAFQGDAQFLGATFQGDAWFGDATFQRDALFGDATFQRDARFGRATFQGNAWFGRATFQRDAWFSRAIFQDYADFGKAIFQGEAAFSEAIVFGSAGANFQHDANFAEATFSGDAWFSGVTFSSDAWFSGVTFQRDTSFARVTFRRDASFNEATFQQTRQLGPMLVRKRLRLDQASFHERIQVEVAAAAVFCRRTRFLGGVQLRVRWAQVVLDDADLAAPSILTGVPPFAGLDEGRWARAMERLLPQPLLEPDRRWKPCLLSLHRADVAGLTVATTDLRSCQFADALNLDKVRIETVRAFAHTPRGWRWTARLALAEEHHWRHHRVTSRQPPERPMATARDARPQGDPDRSWWPPACRPPSWAASAPLTPTRIASIYRALRKGREDHKDEPGAADFYYGEMEMRRHAQRQDATAQRKRRHYGAWAVATTEYMVLWLYWVTCGYALKAWRALATLAVVVLLAGGVFAWWGFASPAEPDIRPVAVDAQGRPIYARQPVERPAGLDELPDAIRFSAQAATALLRGPDRPLTAYGEWLHLALRLVGPVLLGLAVLSIRGRVKR